jgi:hypothetical protein
MSAESTITVKGGDRNEFSRSLSSALRALPEPERARLEAIFSHYFSVHGVDYAYSRMNEKTVGQILAEFTEVLRKPSVTGEIDGVRFQLFDPPEKATVSNQTRIRRRHGYENSRGSKF